MLPSGSDIWKGMRDVKLKYLKVALKKIMKTRWFDDVSEEKLRKKWSAVDD